ncbi:KH domain-containing protein [Candidatus Poribacteria bacterium]|nr:KH domain-containing protein [Candidatus Poribacteria bacterium]
MKQVEVVARSQQQAIEKAARHLEAAPEDLHVIEEYEPDQVDLQTLAREEAELTDDQKTGEPVLYMVQQSPARFVQATREWVQGFLDRLQPGCHIEVLSEEDHLRIIVHSDEPSILIGKQGQTLAAIQHVVSRAVPRGDESFPELVVDVGDYVETRHAKLERIAESAAARAVRTRRNVALLPMNSHDRKFVHNRLKTLQGVTTVSEGRDPDRHIVIEVPGGDRPGAEDDSDRPHHRGGRRRGGRRDDNRGNRAPEPRSRPSGPAWSPHSGDEAAPGPAKDYSDVEIEERPSRLPAYKEQPVDAALLDPDRPLVDELE